MAASSSPARACAAASAAASAEATHAWSRAAAASAGPPGVCAPEAAGAIHTDFEKGFIRAETIAYADYVAGKGEAGAREAGKMRLEGKEYLVQDGDIMHFRFNA